MARADQMMAAAGKRDWPTLLGLYLIVTAYNLFKPFHIDDAAHLLIAQWIAGHPLHPMSGPLNWIGTDERIAATNQPHLLFYLYALWGSLFGFGEVAMHLLQSAFSGAAILLFYHLATSLGVARPAWLTALLALNPAFLVEQNLMVDVPLLALWLGFFVVLLTMRHAPRQTLRFGIAGMICGAAILVKYSSLVLVPVLAGAILWERRWSKWWAVAIPLAALCGWSLFNWLDYGGVHILQRKADERDTVREIKLLIAWLLLFGSLVPTGIVIALRGNRRPAARRAVGAIGLGLPFLLAAAVAAGLLGERRADLGLHLIAAANGALIFTLAGLSGWLLLRRRDRVLDATALLYLAAWIGITSIFYILLSPFNAARHGLLILPALLILLARWREGRADRLLDIGAVLATALLSCGIGLSDFRFAAFYRDAVPEIAAQAPAGRTRWVSGHWGLQYYAGRAGFREVDIRASKLSAGDLMLRSDQVYAEAIANPPPMRRIASVIERHPLLELFCSNAPDRFYHSSVRDLPWSISRSCGHRLDLYEVR